MLVPAVFPVPLSLLVYLSPLLSSVQRCVFLLVLAFCNKAVFESAFWLLRSSCLQHTGHDSFVNSDLKLFIQTFISMYRGGQGRCTAVSTSICKTWWSSWWWCTGWNIGLVDTDGVIYATKCCQSLIHRVTQCGSDWQQLRFSAWQWFHVFLHISVNN